MFIFALRSFMRMVLLGSPVLSIEYTIFDFGARSEDVAKSSRVERRYRFSVTDLCHGAYPGIKNGTSTSSAHG